MVLSNSNLMLSLGTLLFSSLLFNISVCEKGIDSKERWKSVRIVGGEYALPQEIPYQVSIYFLNKYVCSGAIVSPKYVVTSGFCGMLYAASSDMHVVGGDHSLLNNDGTEQQIAVKNSTVHPGYNSWTLTNDIALLELETEFVYTAAVEPIQLAPLGRRTSKVGVVSGWGAIIENGPSSDILRKASLSVISDDICRTYYHPTEITDGMLCAGVPEEGKDICNGDGGSPLICYDDEIGVDTLTGKYICGIASWGKGCGKVPGVFTEISYYYPWITQYLENDE